MLIKKYIPTLGTLSQRPFHTSPLLLHKWTDTEDQLLTTRHEKYGPAWTLISLSIPKRSPDACRKRHLTLTSSLDKVKRPSDKKMIFQHAYERHGAGSEGWVQIPIERIESSPFALIARHLPRRRITSSARWSELEQLVVREGYEQYGPDWISIAKKLSRRTPNQARRMMEDRFMLWRPSVCEDSPISLTNSDNVESDLINFVPIPKQDRIVAIEEDLNLFLPREE